MNFRSFLYRTLAVGILGFLLLWNPGVSREEWWRKDLRHLAQELPARHINPFFKTTREEFLRAVNELDKALPSMQDHEIVIGLKRIVTIIGDPHTDLSITFSYFPLRLQWLKDGYFVAGTVSANRSILKSRLVRIGDMDIERVYSAISAVIPHDNKYWLRVRSAQFLTAPAILHALKVVPHLDRAKFHFADSTGNITSLELVKLAQPIDKSDWLDAFNQNNNSVPLYLKKPDVNYWFEHLADSKSLFFQYNRCEEMEKLPFSQFSEQLFKAADQFSVTRLIVDLRHNSGGNSGILWPFILNLKASPHLNRRGHLFVVVGPETYSSGVLNAAELQRETSAILVGEPTGARPNLYGHYKFFTLPNSNLEVSYSTRYFERVPGNPDALMPEISVQTSSAEFFAGRDPVLEKILNYKTKAVTP